MKRKNVIAIGIVIVSMLSFVFLASAFFNLKAPTDEGCVTPEQGVEYILNQSIFEMASVCNSLDKANDTAHPHDNRDSVEDSIYEQNMYITASEANSKNKKVIYFENQARKKGAFKKLLFAAGISSTILALLFIINVVNANRNKQSKNPILKTSLTVIIIFVFLMIVANGNFFQLRVVRLNQIISNFAAHTSIQIFIKDVQEIKLKTDHNSYYEALSNIENFYMINACLNNNMKNLITNKELNNRSFNSENELLEFYDFKNKPYFPIMEKRGNRKISYLYNKSNNFDTISGVSFSECGFYAPKQIKYDAELSTIMRKIDFTDAVANAINTDDYSSGWEKLSTKFDNVYASSQFGDSEMSLIQKIKDTTYDLMFSQNDLLDKTKKQLLISYTIEYKKALMIGVVEFDQDIGHPIRSKSNFKPLQYNLAKADKFYQLVNKSICVENGDVVLDTKNKLSDFKDTSSMSYYACMDFLDGDLNLIFDNVLHPKSNKIEISLELSTLKKQARKMIEDDTLELSSKYDKINEDFQFFVEQTYDFDKKLIRLYNEGYYSLPYALNHIGNAGSSYKHIFSEIVGVNSFDYSKSLPYFSNANKDVDENYNLYNVNTVKRMLPVVSEELKMENQITSSNFTSKLLSEQHDTQSLSFDEDTGSASGSFLDSINRKISSTYKSVGRLTCSINDVDYTIKECQEDSLKGAGAVRYEAAVKELSSTGMLSAASGLTTILAAKTLKYLIPKSDDKDTALGKGKKKGRGKGVKSKIGAAASFAELFGILTAFAGLIMLLCSFLLGLVDQILYVMALAHQASTGMYFVNFDIILMLGLLKALHTSTKGEDYAEGIELIITSILSITKVSLIFVIAQTLGYTLILYMKNYFPFIMQFNTGIDLLSMIMNTVTISVFFCLFVYYLVQKLTRVLDEHDNLSAVKTAIDDGARQANEALKLVVLSKVADGFGKVRHHFHNETMKKMNDESEKIQAMRKDFTNTSSVNKDVIDKK